MRGRRPDTTAERQCDMSCDPLRAQLEYLSLTNRWPGATATEYVCGQFTAHDVGTASRSRLVPPLMESAWRRSCGRFFVSVPESTAKRRQYHVESASESRNAAASLRRARRSSNSRSIMR